MNAKTWQQAKDWLLEAAALPEPERAPFLSARCPDEALRRELLEMLASDGTLSGIVDRATLTSGTRLGRYEIDAVIGAGGMGEVYRASDSRLGRDVAIKVLPAAFAMDRDRLARFEREAKLLASLNHPHICTLFDIGREAGIDFIVMECIEGELLSDRLRKGPLPIDKALGYAIEIADALDKAHAHGIIHRDLKPGNVMLTKPGTKLLDFGLARSTRAPSHDVTRTGMILGTLRYMAPEQLKGADADARSDVWAFGCVLYQMLAGRSPFDGESEAAIGAAILEGPAPPLPAGVPPLLQRVVERCLAKTPDDRWQSVADLRHELEWIAKSGGHPALKENAARPKMSIRERIAWTLAALTIAAGLAIASFVVWRARQIPPPQMTWTSILVPDAIGQASSLALSRDGQKLAYVGRPREGDRSPSFIWVRVLSEHEARRLPGTEGAHFPFWSTDGRSIGFFADGKLKRIDVATGLVKTLCNAPEARGGTWADHTILFVPEVHSGVYRVPDDQEGSQATPVTQPQPDETHRFPSFVADGVHFVFAAQAKDGTVTVRLGSLGDPGSAELATVGRRLTQPYVAHGMLVFAIDGKLLARALDEKRWRVSTDPTLIAEGVSDDQNQSKAFAVSDSAIVYWPATPRPPAELTWISRASGEAQTRVWEPAVFTSVQLSPDDTQAIAERSDGSKSTVWVIDLVRENPRQLTEAATGSRVLWSSDLSHVLFIKPEAQFHQNIYSVPANGSGGEHLVTDQPDDVKFLVGWSGTGSLLYGGNNASSRADLWETRSAGTARIVFNANENAGFNDADVTATSDLIAFAVGGNTNALFVRRFHDREFQQVDNGHLTRPRWRADGRELYYQDLSTGYLMAVDISSGDPMRIGIPRKLFPFKGLAFSPSRDGQRFLAAVPQAVREPPPSVSIVLNWATLLGR